MNKTTRRSTALNAAIGVGTELGLRCDRARVVKDSNNTIVHLAPAPMVAKVGTSSLRSNPLAVLTDELNIGRHLAARGAPIAPPSTEVPAGPHVRDGAVLSLWEYREEIPEATASNHELASALRAFHEAFADYPSPLPSFRDALDRARRVLGDRAATPRLGAADRRLLVNIGAHVAARLKTLEFDPLPLHGDPHPDGNVLITEDGPLFVDFEAACTGPYEWDLTSLGAAGADYPGARSDLLRVLSTMRSLCVATWCWAAYGRAPEVTEAAHVHLRLLRGLGRDVR